jgi:pullulanase
MNEVRAALTAIDPTILVIGEGWNMGALSTEEKAYQQNVTSLPGIAMFNDGIRDGIKGSVFNATEPGWATGDTSRKNNVMAGIVGNIYYSSLIGGDWGTMQPGQSVNYIEAHDNLTLWDKLSSSASGNSAALTRQFKLASSIVLLGQGLPFMQAGQEWMRSKDGNSNSYNASDATNALRWNKRTTNMAVVRYFKGLIAIRKAHPAFRISSGSLIRKNLKFLKTSSSVIAYSIDGSKVGDTWKTVVVIHNSSTKSQVVTLPAKGNWSIASNGNVASTKALSVLKSATKVTVPAQSTYVMFK